MAVQLVTSSFTVVEIRESQMTAVDDFFLDVELVASYSKDCREGSVGRVEFVSKFINLFNLRYLFMSRFFCFLLSIFF